MITWQKAVEDYIQLRRSLGFKMHLSEDAQEGPRSFAEKRPPQWRGR